MARKARHEEGHPNHERWLLTYADLITLLMVFFIVMYATSQTDLVRFAALAAGLQKAFNVPVLEGQDFTSPKGRDGVTAVSAVGTQPTPAPMDVGRAQISLLRTGLYEAIKDDLEQFARERGVEQQVGVALHRDGVMITLSGELLFEPGSAELQAGAPELIWVALARVARLPNEIRVAGHTDSVPLNTAQFPSNWELSTARALVVLHFIADEMQVAPERLVAVGYGPYRPVASNDTPEGRARNRRVELLIVDQSPSGESTP